MIESGMFFVLGLATAGLVAAMVAPVLWRRAIRLTRARIEHAVPASLTEIQADKDQLRAEFAMSARRLETTIATLRQKAGQQLADITSKRELIRRLSEEQAKRVEALEQLEEREAELDKLLRRREDRVAETTAEMKALRASLAERGRALEQIEQTLRETDAAREEQTVELVARGTELENLQDQLATAKSRQTALQIERTRLEAALGEAESERLMAAEKAEALAKRLAGFDEERRAYVGEVNARDREIDQLRAELTSKESANTELDRRLVEAEAATSEAMARISELTLRLDQTANRAPSEEIAGALRDLEAERDQLVIELAASEEKLVKVTAENVELQRVAGDDWETERIQNAMLRERINDIAGEVAALTRSYQQEMGAAELTELAREGDTGRRSGGRGSLSRRIRTLQRSAQSG